MEKKKRTSPATIALLAGGATLAVLFAGWSIKRTLSPPAPPSAAAPPGTAATSGAAEGAAATPGTGPVASRPAPSGEAGLALGADPFVPLPAPLAGTAVASGRAGLPSPTVATAGYRGSAGLPPIGPLVALPPGPGMPGGGVTTIRPGAESRLPSLPGPSVVPAVPAAPEEPAPTLIGTLTGDQASAVFRADSRLVVVPILGKLGTWQVLSVDHGAAVVRSGSRTLRLQVGGDRVPGIARAEEAPAPRPRMTAPPPPAPTPETTPEPPRRRPTRRPLAEGAPSLYEEPPLVEEARPVLQAMAPSLEPEPVDPAPLQLVPEHEPGPVALPTQISIPMAEKEPDPPRPDDPPVREIADITED